MNAFRPFVGKLAEKRVWERIFRERLSEPLHLNLAAAFVSAFGSFRTKVYFDLVYRHQNAFGLLQAADFAKSSGRHAFTAIEFGVANGAGMLNMAAIAAKVTAATGIEIDLVGFDTGRGMPPPADYRDHPRLYGTGDFPMQDFDALRRRLPASAQLLIGPISETMKPFLNALSPGRPIGYVVLDVDYYSSAVDSLAIFAGTPELYLPEVILYLDDIFHVQHNRWQGEYLAIDEFNSEHGLRKIGPYNFLRSSRLFKNATWIEHIYLVNVLDHALQSAAKTGGISVLDNPYLKIAV